jgi:DNA-binding transcriptional MerR regulator
VPGIALPDKLFFKIGEVAQIVGVRAHVLRYWESEFAALRPLKTRGSHRVYRRRDVELAVLLRRLLHDEGLTIAGAKRRLREREPNKGHLIAEPETPAAVQEDDGRAELVAMREELTALLIALDSAVRSDEPDAPLQPPAAADADHHGASEAPRGVPVHTHKRPVS